MQHFKCYFSVSTMGIQPLHAQYRNLKGLLSLCLAESHEGKLALDHPDLDLGFVTQKLYKKDWLKTVVLQSYFFEFL